MKGVTIFLVVFGHCMQYENGRDFAYTGAFLEYVLYKMIYSFHMPLFALVSGYLFFWSVSSRSPREVLIRQAKNLILPAVSWSVMLRAAGTVFHIYRGDFAGISTTLMKIYTGIFGLWFLWAMLFSSVIVILVKTKLCDSLKVYALILAVLLFMPVSSLYVFTYPYFVAGYIWHREHMDEKFALSDNKLLCVGIILVWCIMLLFYDKSSYVYITGIRLIKYRNGAGEFVPSQLWTDIFRWLIGFAGCGAVLILLKLVKPIKFIAALGVKSLGIYITSGYVTKAVLLAVPIADNEYIIRFIQAVIITAICYVLSEAISRVKILNKIFFGGR